MQFPISYRDLERMLADRGVAVDHTTMHRWVQRSAAALASRENVEQLLGKLVEVVRRAGLEQHAAFQEEGLPVTGNA